MEFFDCTVGGHCSTTVAVTNNTSECKNLHIRGLQTESDSSLPVFHLPSASFLTFCIEIESKRHNRLYSSKGLGTPQIYVSVFSRMFEK